MSIRKLAKITLILVYLVIIAGAVVRMTGSGMGCPDWPKCFGTYIPPTEISQLQWQPNKDFNKGQIIIVKETLQIAKKDFKTAATYTPENWELYTKHDYAIFNPWHTWIEYINRLFGALAGLATLVLAIATIKFWRKKRSITLLSWMVVLGMGFQAWLGATVVYSVLEPVKITLHMLMALLIVAMLLFVMYCLNEGAKGIRFNKTTILLAIVALSLTLLQIVMGTQVRQFVDHQIDLFGVNAKEMWLDTPSLLFFIHRSFSIVVVFINVLLAYRVHKFNPEYVKIYWILFLLTIEIFSGIAMYYLDFPFASQPLHLVLASILFAVQFYLVLDALKAKTSPKTL